MLPPSDLSDETGNAGAFASAFVLNFNGVNFVSVFFY